MDVEREAAVAGLEPVCSEPVADPVNHRSAGRCVCHHPGSNKAEEAAGWRRRGAAGTVSIHSPPHPPGQPGSRDTYSPFDSAEPGSLGNVAAAGCQGGTSGCS